MAVNRGSCLCGDVTWEVDGDFTMMVNCHCSICRKVHGSAYGTFVATAVENFRWTSGEGGLRYYASSAKGKRPFCARCGSEAAAIMDGMIVMPAGNLDGDIRRPLDSHIFVASKACWFDITDDAPQFDAYPPDYDVPLTPRPLRQAATAGAIGGSCDCGKVAYEFDGPAERMGYCHCSRCRRARSAAFAAQAFVPIDRFRWLKGDGNVDDFKLPEAKYFVTTFCRDCGSPMPKAFPDFDMVMIPAGSLDQDPGCRPQAHIYVGSKAAWDEITDDLPQFEESAPR
jgi:hypothetical protein